MNRSKWVERSFVACVVLCLIPVAWVTAEDESAQHQVAPEPLFTFPSDKRNLSFPEMGLVSKLMVKPGDVVKKGDLLATEDTDQEEIQYRAERIEAESMAEVDAAVADHESKMLVFNRLQKAAEATNPSELEEAKVAAEIAEIKIRDAKEQREEKIAELAKEGKKIDRMHLYAPMDGIIEKISVFPGEVTDPVKPEGVLTLVTNQPMWADMHLLTAQAAKLKMGDAVQVAYQNDPEKWFDAKVIYFDPVADAASDKQTVRIQWDNSDGKPAGLAMNLRLPPMSQNP